MTRAASARNSSIWAAENAPSTAAETSSSISRSLVRTYSQLGREATASRSWISRILPTGGSKDVPGAGRTFWSWSRSAVRSASTSLSGIDSAGGAGRICGRGPDAASSSTRRRQ